MLVEGITHEDEALVVEAEGIIGSRRDIRSS
jgi:hypothetical protein